VLELEVGFCFLCSLSYMFFLFAFVDFNLVQYFTENIFSIKE
jgi:hypothetical protein